ncbi:uncharacterized protein LOC128849912 isoform X6 [Cuculus canorus]|uniref:uncharacterized protein LOC128849912 isoform X6 n=2 Tax=Cuculus canorus TaxID=55661 RepID=UPI0023AABCB4|nr:uncharacterized protein LOC128849912 isoform X6 [Cuculus canorus]
MGAPPRAMEREGVLLLTRIVPGESDLGSVPPKPGTQRLWGEPLALGLLVSGALLVALGQSPSVGRARAALAVGIVAAVVSLVALGLQALLLPHGCPTCDSLGPTAQEALVGAHGLLMTSSVGGAAMALTGAVTAGRGGATRGGTPIVIYQTALPGLGAGLGEATPTGTANQ